MQYNMEKVQGGDMVFYFDFGDNLKQLRKQRNLTQKELGSQLGLSKAVISKYENGLGYPTFDVLIRIAQHFGVTTDYLLGVSGNKTADITGLTESQVNTIHMLIAEFRKANI